MTSLPELDFLYWPSVVILAVLVLAFVVLALRFLFAKEAREDV